MKTLRLLLPLAVFLIIVAFLWVGLYRDPREVPSPLVDKPAPAFRLAQLDDPAKKLGPEDLKGQVWLLNVWASWCVSCRVEHPVLVELAKSNLVPVIGLNYKDRNALGAPGSRTTATRTRCPSSTRTAASASTGASTACRRHSSSTRTA